MESHESEINLTVVSVDPSRFQVEVACHPRLFVKRERLRKREKQLGSGPQNTHEAPGCQ